MFSQGPAYRYPELLDPELLDPELLDPELLDPELLDPELLDPELLVGLAIDGPRGERGASAEFRRTSCLHFPTVARYNTALSGFHWKLAVAFYLELCSP